MTITVTQEDIDEAYKMDCERCPIALAVNRALSIDNSHVGRWIITEARNWDTPPIARQFMERFDLGMPVQPFKFALK